MSSFMQRRIRVLLAAALLVAGAGAPAQNGSLAGVTMRVLDDMSGIDAAIIVLDTDRGQAADAVEERAGAR